MSKLPNVGTIAWIYTWQYPISSSHLHNSRAWPFVIVCPVFGCYKSNFLSWSALAPFDWCWTCVFCEPGTAFWCIMAVALLLLGTFQCLLHYMRLQHCWAAVADKLINYLTRTGGLCAAPCQPRLDDWVNKETHAGSSKWWRWQLLKICSHHPFRYASCNEACRLSTTNQKAYAWIRIGRARAAQGKSNY